MAPDERLVELVRGGSEAAFEAVYDRHHRSILAFCRHMLASPDEAEDAVQHTFMAAYRHLTGGDAEIQLRPWLYAIARNRCLTMLRARRERPLAEYEEPATEHLSAEAQRRQDVRELLGDVARLPEEQRAALVLAEIGAVPHDEIALVLDVPRQKVKALVFQARTSLAASRKARDTPCAEIREQLANLRGGSLRRTTLSRHVRECEGCRAFRDEVGLQRKTLAVALPVIPSIGLKEAALGAAFGSAGAGGGAAAVSGGALAAKALVAVALVGGGTTAGVEVSRHAPPPAPRAAERSAPVVKAAPAADVLRPVATPRIRRAAAPVVVVRQREPSHHEPKPHAVHHPAKPASPPAHARHEAKVKAVKPAHAEKPRPVKQHAAPPGQAKKEAKPKPVPPGQAKKQDEPVEVKVKAVPPGQAKKQATEPVLVPPAAPELKGHGKQR